MKGPNLCRGNIPHTTKPPPAAWTVDEGTTEPCFHVLCATTLTIWVLEQVVWIMSTCLNAEPCDWLIRYLCSYAVAGVPNEVANAAYFIAEDCCCMWFLMILALLCTFSCFTLLWLIYVVTPQQPFFERSSIWVTVAVSSCFRGSKAARMLRLPTLITTLRPF